MRFKGKMYKSKGITLIALIITIIVLLILAGVTIASLTGSDSAPAKANEASQKNAIGSAKDEVYLCASNAQTEAYERVYVEGKKYNVDEYATAGQASTEVGKFVRAKIYDVYKSTNNKKVGLASIVANENGEITISTTDFKEYGLIDLSGGALSWITPVAISTIGEITPANPKVGEGKEITLSVTINEDATESVTWKSDDETIATVVSTGKNTATVTGGTGKIGEHTTITAKNIDGTISKTTTVTVIEAPEPEVTLGEVDTSTNATTGKTYVEMFGWNVNYVSRENKTDWKLFYRDNTNTYIISDSLVESTAPNANYNSAATGASIANVGRGLNPMVAEYFVAGNSWNNLKGTEWFTKISNWTKYTDTAGNAKFAIASPTAELFQKSFNETHKGGNQISLEKGTLGYKLNTSEKWLMSTDNYGIYNKDGSTDWWLGSPVNNSYYCVLVWGSGGVLSYTGLDYAARLRPLVCFQNSVFDENYNITQP